MQLKTKERQVLTAQTMQKKICMATCCTSFNQSETGALREACVALMMRFRADCMNVSSTPLPRNSHCLTHAEDGIASIFAALIPGCKLLFTCDQDHECFGGSIDEQDHVRELKHVFGFSSVPLRTKERQALADRLPVLVDLNCSSN